MAGLLIVLTFVILAIIAGIMIAVILIAGKQKREMTGKDYRYFFYIGIAYLSGGIALTLIFPRDMEYFNFFTFMGIIFTAMGLSNLDKWRRK